MGGERETIDLFLTRRVGEADLLDSLRAIELDGCAFLEVRPIPIKAASLEAAIEASVYRVAFTARPPDLAGALARFEAAAELAAEVRKKDETRRVDLKRSLAGLRLSEDEAGLTLAVRHGVGLYLKPQEAVSALVGENLELGLDLRIDRIGFRMRNA
jgi:hypothetical protein